MSKRAYLLFFVCGLVVQSLVAWFQSTPGYMDAAYYFAGGQQIAAGRGMVEPYLWNYLADLGDLPVPSHAYWMPLASWIAAAGMLLAGSGTYAAAKLGFILIAALLPVLTADLAYRLSNRQDQAVLAGVLALLAGFYLPYLPTSDTFGWYMLAGGGFVWVVLRWSEMNWLSAALLGLLAGGMHLARADGVLWLLLALVYVSLVRWRLDARRLRIAVMILSVLAGYLLVMAPWMARNWSVFHTLLSPGGLKALWFTGYNDLFVYPGSVINYQRFLDQGWRDILADRLWAAGQNLQTLLAVQGAVFLLPLILWGGWQTRRHNVVRLGAAAWLLTFLAMTLAFPFPGARGGFFHSGAALQPLAWALVPAGLHAFVQWGKQHRGWNPAQAWPVFAAGLCLLALGLSIFLIRLRVVGSDPAASAWDAEQRHHARLEMVLEQAGAQAGQVVMVNNAPQYYLASGRPAISIPYGDLEMLLTVAQRYHADYLWLEFNQLLDEEDLYADPGTRPGLVFLGSEDNARLYQIVGAP